MKRKLPRKTLALLMALIMLFSLMPTAALAAGREGVMPETPIFTVNLSAEPVTHTVGDTAASLFVTAEVTDGGMLTYQWYSVATGVNGGEPQMIEGADASNYTPPTETAGTVSYYVVVTNSLGGETAAAASNYAPVTVEEASKYEISISDVIDSTRGKLNSIRISGAEVESHTRNSAGNAHEFIILLKEGTEPDATIEIRFDVGRQNDNVNLMMLSPYNIAEEGVENGDITNNRLDSYIVKLTEGRGEQEVFLYETPMAVIQKQATASFTITLAVDDGSGGASAASRIVSTQLENGQWVMEDNFLGSYSGHIVELYGRQTELTVTLSKPAGVTLNGQRQDVTDKLSCTMALFSNQEVDDDGRWGAVNSIVVTDAETGQSKNYTIRCMGQLYDDLPDAVADYLVVDSQYCNGGAPAGGVYGVAGVATLVGQGTSAQIRSWLSGPASLGGWGGYITYYYEDAVTDNPNNPYGVDFLVHGNSYSGTEGFAEPGAVWVSEDGESWYILAGSDYYGNTVSWNYSMTYSKLENGKTHYQSNTNSEHAGDSIYNFPLRHYYPLHEWGDDENTITLTGLFAHDSGEQNDYGNKLPTYPDFGYTDVGLMVWERGGSGNQGANPYTGLTQYQYGEGYLGRELITGRADGFDLAWAVDADGQPVSFPNGIHYVKVQSVNQIYNGAIGEKSTEVNLMRLAEAAGEQVGKADAPSAILIGGQEIPLEEGRQVYDVTVNGIFAAEVRASKDANIYINSARGASYVFNGMPAHNMIRIIVQEGEKEPVIYYINLTAGEDVSQETATLTLDPNGGWVYNSLDSTEITFTEEMAGLPLPEPIGFSSSVKKKVVFDGWYLGQVKYTGFPSDLSDITLKARWRQSGDDEEQPPAEETVDVIFRLIGSTLSGDDVDLSLGEEGYFGAEYKTWIKTAAYKMPKGTTVGNLILQALKDAGLVQEGASNNYISAINAPEEYGGYELREFTNGVYSGWMYTVNGAHPAYGLNEYVLQEGDAVIWHYVNDYRYEPADWDTLGGAAFPALGDGTFHNAWLQATDVNPGEDEPVLTPPVDAIDGTAAAKLTEADMEGAIEAVKKEGGDITIKPQINGEADKVSVELPRASLSTLVSATEAGLRVETPVGNVTIPHEALTSIVAQAEGDHITVSVESVDKEKALTTEQKETVGDKPVFDITIKSGDKEIGSFNGGCVTISLPYTLKDGETADEVKVWYLNDAGELEEISCSYDAETGLAAFTTDHLSYYTVGTDKSENEDAVEAKKVDDLIAKISDPVTLADKEAIEKARAAYNALTERQKNLVTKLQQLKATEKALSDLQAAKAVEDKIAAIGTVTLESKAKLEDARAAYDALTPAQAKLVSNYQTLVAAEKAYEALVKQEPGPTPSPGDGQNKPPADDKQVKTVPATGDLNSALLAMLLLIALCAGGYLYCRRGKEENSL